MAESWRLCRLREAQKALTEITNFLGPALPFLNSHNVDFFVENYWEKYLPHKLRKDYENKSLGISPQYLKQHIDKYSSTNWIIEMKKQTKDTIKDINFNNSSWDEIITKIGELDLQYMQMSLPFENTPIGNFFKLHQEEIKVDQLVKDDLIFERFLKDKKLHEVQRLGYLIYRVSKISSHFCSSRDINSFLSIIKQDTENISPFPTPSVPPALNQNKTLSSNGSSSFNKTVVEDQLTASSSKPLKVSLSDKNLRIVDIGSGKGYLSSFLALLYKFQVVGLEYSRGNVKASSERGERLQKRWFKILNRALEREQKLTSVNVLKTEDDIQLVPNASCQNDTLENITHSDYNFNYRKVFVHGNLNLNKEFPELIPPEAAFGIVGLHTCGGLGTDSVKLFLHHSNSRFLVNVPCCYHHLEEVVYPNCIPEDTPHSRKVAKARSEMKINSDILINSGSKFFDPEDAAALPFPNFPMSDFLQEKRFNLGRNARMLSSFSFQRMGKELEENNMEIDQLLIWRLILQVIINEKQGNNNLEYHVGKVKHVSTFEEYVYKALEKIHLTNLNVTKVDIRNAYEKCQPDFQRFQCYYILRTMFAPLIEACIILDRLIYILEQGDLVWDAFIVTAFDRLTSPRCHAIVALRTPRENST